jgi:zinc protease
MFKLSEAVRKAAFRRHPYREQVIGSMADLRAITRDDLYNHYQRYYTPSNAIIAVAGDFQTKDLLENLTQKYDSLESLESNGEPIIPENTIEEFSEVVVEGPEETVYFELSYRAPSAEDPDFFSLMVVDSLLTGPTSLSMFGGGGISNKTSRLYKAIVEKDAAMSVSGGLQSTIDPYLYNILAITSPDKDTGLIKTIIDGEIARLQDTPVAAEEIARAIKQAKALFAYGSESITNQAFWMGYAAIFADHSWFDNFIHNLESVTAESVMRAARKYLKSDQRVVGIYRPAKGVKS